MTPIKVLRCSALPQGCLYPTSLKPQCPHYTYIEYLGHGEIEASPICHACNQFLLTKVSFCSYPMHWPAGSLDYTEQQIEEGKWENG